MSIRLLVASISCFITVNTYSGQSEEGAGVIRFAVPNFKPYSFVQNNKLKGVGIDKVKALMSKLDQSYFFRFVPNYGRAVEELRRGRVDGMFLASENEERNAIAEFSVPVLINRWSWFLNQPNTLDPHSELFKRDVTVATQLNTNTHKWLVKNNYLRIYPAKDPMRLANILDRGRLRAVFIAEEVFKSSVKQHRLNSNGFEQIVQFEKPFGIYISKRYLDKYPEFMIRLNQAITELNEPVNSSGERLPAAN